MYKSKEIICRAVDLRTKALQLGQEMLGRSAQSPRTFFQMQESNRERAQVEAQLIIQGRIEVVPEFSYEEKMLRIAGQEIKWQRPAHFPSTNPDFLLAYVLTQRQGEEMAGSGKTQGQSSIYKHIWENAYMDAARIILTQNVQLQTQAIRIESIAPGFDQMPLQDTQTLLSYLDGATYQITVNEYGMMVPEKTVIGLYLVWKEQESLGRGKIPCNACLTPNQQCQFCMFGKYK